LIANNDAKMSMSGIDLSPFDYLMNINGEMAQYYKNYLKLCGRLTIVGGDSGTGKSFLLTLVSKYNYRELMKQNGVITLVRGKTA